MAPVDPPAKIHWARLEVVMSRAWQAERAMEREQDALDADYASGRISLQEYNKACRDIQYEMKCAYEQDMEDAAESVRNDWGW